MQIKVGDGIAGIVIFLILFLVVNCASYYLYQDIIKKHKHLKGTLKYNFFAVLRLNLYRYVSKIYFYLNLAVVIMTFALITVMIIHLCEVLGFIYIQVIGITWFVLLISLGIWLSIYFRKTDRKKK